MHTYTMQCDCVHGADIIMDMVCAAVYYGINIENLGINFLYNRVGGNVTCTMCRCSVSSR